MSKATADRDIYVRGYGTHGYPGFGPCVCGVCEEMRASEQRMDYLRAAWIAPIALIVVWALACGVLLAFGN